MSLVVSKSYNVIKKCQFCCKVIIRFRRLSYSIKLLKSHRKGVAAEEIHGNFSGATSHSLALLQMLALFGSNGQLVSIFGIVSVCVFIPAPKMWDECLSSSGPLCSHDPPLFRFWWPCNNQKRPPNQKDTQIRLSWNPGTNTWKWLKTASIPWFWDLYHDQRGKKHVVVIVICI